MNVTNLFNQQIISGITFLMIAKALIILLIGIILAKAIKSYLISLSRTTRYVWIINEDTANLTFKFILILSLVGSLSVLGERILSYEIAGTTIRNIISAVVIFYFSYLIAKKSKDYLLMSGVQKGKVEEAQIKAKLFYYIIVFAALIVSLDVAGFLENVDSLLVAGGITGIVLGFSAQTVIANFVSGIFMYFDRPLKIGDPVEIAGYGGIVNDIRILSTRIRTWDGTLVRIPNEKVFNSEIRNLMKYPARRVDIKIGIAYREDVNKAIEVIKKTLDEMPYVLAEPEPTVFVNELADNSIIISVRVWAPSEKWFDVRTQIVQRVKEALDREGIEIPFPQRVNWFAEELRVRIEKEQ